MNRTRSLAIKAIDRAFKKDVIGRYIVMTSEAAIEADVAAAVERFARSLDLAIACYQQARAVAEAIPDNHEV